MDTTAIWGAQTALHRLLKASDLAGLDPACPVDLGVPEGGPRAPWHVWIPGRVDEWNRRHDVSGLTAVEETFVVEVHLLAWAAPDRTFETRQARLVRLVDVVGAAVASDPRLGGAVRLAEVRRFAIDESLTPETRFLGGVAEVACQATICP